MVVSVSDEEGMNSITIPPNTNFYYESDQSNPLKMYEMAKPNHNRENIEIFSETPLFAQHQEMGPSKK